MGKACHFSGSIYTAETLSQRALRSCITPLFTHTIIRTYPFQVAVERNIPLIVWGEHGFAELTGIISLEDFVEFTRWTRKEHDMRGYEPHDLIGKGGITEHDIAPYIYPNMPIGCSKTIDSLRKVVRGEQ